MSENRVIKYIDLETLSEVDELFERHSGVDTNNIDPKYGDTVLEAKKLVMENCRAALVYERVGIESKGEESVTLTSGQTLVGKMVGRVLDKSDEAYLFVISLDGFTKCSSDDIMIEYFADTWATAFVESAQATFADMVAEELKPENLKRTYVWCPGQTQFELANQRPLFDLLNPEDIGCTLTSKLMMVPVKSASGLMGVVAADVEVTLIPCDFCSFKKNCPASKRGCAAL